MTVATGAFVARRRGQVFVTGNSGFPKSLDVSKAIDKAEGHWRGRAGAVTVETQLSKGTEYERTDKGDPITDDAKKWQGWGTALKPCLEKWALLRKPHDVESYCGMMARQIWRSLCLLRSHARDAGWCSASSLSEFVEGVGSARWSAVEKCNTPGDLYDLMATWQSASEMPSSLSIAWSWLDTLAALSTLANTCTTETASSLITVLRTSKCSQWPITPDTIAASAIPRSGIESNVEAVASALSVSRSLLASTQTPTVTGTAISSPYAGDLSPALDQWALLRKPLSEKTVAANVLKWGAGGLNIDGCRYSYGDPAWPGPNEQHTSWATVRQNGPTYGDANTDTNPPSVLGRFPANVYVCPKPSTAEREIGCGHLAKKSGAELVGRNANNKGINSPRAGAGRTSNGRGNTHATVKPIRLMQWLCRLVTPPGGLVLDPFAGSGTTGMAAMREGFRFVGFELRAHACEIARARIGGDMPLFSVAVPEMEKREAIEQELPW